MKGGREKGRKGGREEGEEGEKSEEDKTNKHVYFIITDGLLNDLKTIIVPTEEWLDGVCPCQIV